MSTYEMKVISRLTGAEKTDGLEQEGRGTSEFFRKWKRMMRLWGVAEDGGGGGQAGAGQGKSVRIGLSRRLSAGRSGNRPGLSIVIADGAGVRRWFYAAVVPDRRDCAVRLFVFADRAHRITARPP